MKLKTVDIKGKAYVEVNERLRYFRENYADYSLTSHIEEITDTRIIIKASIANIDGRILAEGIAYEKEGSNYINKTSFVENCETSAWGRALANFGIGIDASVASAQEVANAIKQQSTSEDKPEQIVSTEGIPVSEAWMGHEWKDEKQRKLFIGLVSAIIPVEDHPEFEKFLLLAMNSAIIAEGREPKMKISQGFITHCLKPDNMNSFFNEFAKE